MRSWADAQLQRSAEAKAQVEASAEPVWAPLRSALLGVAGVREALAGITPLSTLTAGALPEVSERVEPCTRLDSLRVVDVPPFLHQTASTVIGHCDSRPFADDSGNLSVVFRGGTNHGAGHGQAWAAIGQGFTTPSAGFLRFSATASYTWACAWSSYLWRLGGGSVWIGQVVSLFDTAGRLISTPVLSQTTLFSYNDYNLSDTGSQHGESLGVNLATPLVSCPAGALAECWVWVGSSADADSTGGVFGGGVSSAANTISARVGSLVIDYFV
jgi:hypothetical protein